MNGVNICGGIKRITKRKPKNWMEDGYTMVVPFRFKWRATFGGIECDCTQVIEHYLPYLGFTFFHSDSCAIRTYLKKWPSRANFCFEWDPMVITQSQ